MDGAISSRLMVRVSIPMSLISGLVNNFGFIARSQRGENGSQGHGPVTGVTSADHESICGIALGSTEAIKVAHHVTSEGSQYRIPTS